VADLLDAYIRVTDLATGMFREYRLIERKLIEVHRRTHPAKLPPPENGLEKSPARK
jgi:hypothetical protein